MRALVVYESMYGNTHTIADAIAAGLGDADGVDEVRSLPVVHATPADLEGMDLVVVGGPTHVHGMTRESTRTAAIEGAQKPDSDLEVDPDADPGEGVRDWLAEIGSGNGAAAAAFDTRIDKPSLVTGRASKGIDRALRHHGFAPAVKPQSVLVTTENDLLDGEAERAREWGRSLAAHASVPAES
jgi:flavodoxin